MVFFSTQMPSEWVEGWSSLGFALKDVWRMLPEVFVSKNGSSNFQIRLMGFWALETDGLHMEVEGPTILPQTAAICSQWTLACERWMLDVKLRFRRDGPSGHGGLSNGSETNRGPEDLQRANEETEMFWSVLILCKECSAAYRKNVVLHLSVLIAPRKDPSLVRFGSLFKVVST